MAPAAVVKEVGRILERYLECPGWVLSDGNRVDFLAAKFDNRSIKLDLDLISTKTETEGF
jgi:hypothetical protein